MRVQVTPGASIVAACYPPSRRDARAWMEHARQRLRLVGWVKPPRSLVFAVARGLGPVRFDAAMARAMEPMMGDTSTPAIHHE